MIASEKFVSTKETDDDATNVVVNELKGRNVTILKTKTSAAIETKTRVGEDILNSSENVIHKPEERTSKEATEKSNDLKKGESKDELKPKRIKITKKMIEEKLIAAFVKDIETMQNETKNCYIVGNCYSCKKCEFETKSEGMFRRHKSFIHDSRETNQNIILGFESDVQMYAKILEEKGDSLDKFKCNDCEYAIYSNGKLTLHTLTTHQG